MSAAIVCGFDGKPGSWRALRIANDLARRSGQSLQVLHVPEPAAGPVQRERYERVRSLVRATLGRTDLRVQLDSGPAANALIYASRQAAALVIGTRGHGLFRQALRGGVSAAVTRRAACPVIVVPPRLTDVRTTFDDATLLCAVRDDRDLAAAATAACWACDLGMDLVLASVAPPPRAPVAGMAAPHAVLIPSTSERLETTSRHLDALAEQVSPLANPRTRVVSGPVGRQLRRLAADGRAGLIVTGPLHHGVMRSAAAGSPVRELVRRGRHAVMICPPADGALSAFGGEESGAQARSV